MRKSLVSILVAASILIAGCGGNHGISARDKHRIQVLTTAIRADLRLAGQRRAQLGREAPLRARARAVVLRWAKEETAVFAIDPGAGLGAVDAYLGRLERISPTLVLYGAAGKPYQINREALHGLTRPPSQDPALARYRLDIGRRIAEMERLVHGAPATASIAVDPEGHSIRMQRLIQRLYQEVSVEYAGLGRRLTALRGSLTG